ncbi:uncharacterized protein EV422DRAFT_570781 [Fimicolochytrium jonesii]|uniref:uncharacterized protein n=1 Tax=Fimicolochytrium jonesii TaxID=1396493 RepID=UPI0022FEC838|nr:uncharacterized protein EV422DRAFT_570781 [Fimicolochytrium jonesii]KAI8817437.1 hypothetical protein EV422DRAFT_570781 [Fimicolochytrium jonesii]
MTSSPRPRKRRPKPSLDWLPEELFPQIAQHLTLFDVLRLTRVSKRWRSSLKCPGFGKLLLEKEEETLTVDFFLSMPVGGLDVFEIGIVLDDEEVEKEYSAGGIPTSVTKHPPPPSLPLPLCVRKTTYFVHHRTADTSDLHLLTVRASGAVSIESRPIYPGPVLCTLDDAPTLDAANGGSSDRRVAMTADHRRTCPLCGNASVGEICFWVDKRYRVFFQSWDDKYDFTEPGRAPVHITLMHEEDHGHSWSSPPPLPDVPQGDMGQHHALEYAVRLRQGWYAQFTRRSHVQRYGLVQGASKGARLEAFFGLGGDAPDGDVADPVDRSRWGRNRRDRAPAAPIAIYNPWA